MSKGREQQNDLVLKRIREVQNQIDTALPPGAVVPRHTDGGHFYQVPSGNVYPSVTGYISYVKDPSIQQFDMNEALRYVEKHIHTVVVDGEIDLMVMIDVLTEAKKASKGILKDAGDIGTQIHDRREEYYQKWIDTETRPDIEDFYDVQVDDKRLVSAMRALNKFVNEHEYIPIRCEMLVYDDKLEVAGTLDDLGMVNSIVRKGDKNCDHDLWYDGFNTRCMQCDMKRKWELALTDLKSSNQFKDSYFLQVALYQMMFVKLTKIKPSRNFILKTSKEDGQYKMEELKQMPRLIANAKRVVAAAKAMDAVKKIRKKSNTKKTISI